MSILSQRKAKWFAQAYSFVYKKAKKSSEDLGMFIWLKGRGPGEMWMRAGPKGSATQRESHTCLKENVGVTGWDGLCCVFR